MNLSDAIIEAGQLLDSDKRLIVRVSRNALIKLVEAARRDLRFKNWQYMEIKEPPNA